MSRAFVDEDAGKDLEQDLPELALPLPPGGRNYMTPEGAADLQSGLRVLTGEVRPALSTALADAERGEVSHGTAGTTGSGAAGSGGAEIAALKARLAETDRRISYLSKMSALIEVVHPPEHPERVAFGVCVLAEEEDGTLREWRIVGVDESDPERGLVGWSSPLARGLMGGKQGDSVRIILPEGEKIMTIRALRAPESRQQQTS